ncbi:response regulator [Candidatus Clostridium stratigraminis]|uniref:Stage 0 sporulation protein A homolog n=1 Tax=Candidatus Clostridium stratigraminis TaxID=3381661 RepID=A0ABW8T6Y1_9CLOT
MMKILIVEDDADSRRYIQKILSNCGKCDLTVDGIEAIDAFLLAHDENEPYNLLCVDIMMPKIDGTKVIKIVRDLERQKGIIDKDKAKIIVTSALSDRNLIEKCMLYGCNKYIAKPFEVEEIFVALAELNLIK